MPNLIDPAVVRQHIALVHEHAAAAIAGLLHSRPVVLQMCSMNPDDRRFYTSAYNVGDVDHMTADVLIDSEAGKNCFIEPRLVRPGRPGERGTRDETLAVFACVGDSYNDGVCRFYKQKCRPSTRGRQIKNSDQSGAAA